MALSCKTSSIVYIWFSLPNPLFAGAPRLVTLENAATLQAARSAPRSTARAREERRIGRARRRQTAAESSAVIPNARPSKTR